MHSKAVHQTSLRQQHHGQPHSVNGGARVAHTSHESKSEQMHERINQLQNSTAKAAIRLASHSQPQLNQDPGIVEGYLENVCEIFFLYQFICNFCPINFLNLIKFRSAESRSAEITIAKCAYSDDDKPTETHAIFGRVSQAHSRRFFA